MRVLMQLWLTMIIYENVVYVNIMYMIVAVDIVDGDGDCCC